MQRTVFLATLAANFAPRGAVSALTSSQPAQRATVVLTADEDEVVRLSEQRRMTMTLVPPAQRAPFKLRTASPGRGGRR